MSRLHIFRLLALLAFCPSAASAACGLEVAKPSHFFVWGPRFHAEGTRYSSVFVGVVSAIDAEKNIVTFQPTRWIKGVRLESVKADGPYVDDGCDEGDRKLKVQVGEQWIVFGTMLQGTVTNILISERLVDGRIPERILQELRESILVACPIDPAVLNRLGAEAGRYCACVNSKVSVLGDDALLNEVLQLQGEAWDRWYRAWDKKTPIYMVNPPLPTYQNTAIRRFGSQCGPPL